MSEKNLVQELGRDYVTNYFNGALFRDGDDIYQFNGMITNTQGMSQKFHAGQRGAWEEIQIPASKLKNFGTFSIPALGYRNVGIGNNETVIRLWHSRSTRRGFRLEHVGVETVAPFDMLGDVPVWELMDRWAQVDTVYNPKFVPLKLGIPQLLNHESIGFAVNPDTAVTLDADGDADNPWTIHYKGNKVGGIDENGVIMIRHKVVNRRDVRRTLELE